MGVLRTQVKWYQMLIDTFHILPFSIVKRKKKFIIIDSLIGIHNLSWEMVDMIKILLYKFYKLICHWSHKGNNFFVVDNLT